MYHESVQPFAKSSVDLFGYDASPPPWVDEVLDGDVALDRPDDERTVLARFVRDVESAVTDETERERIIRAALLAAAGPLDEGED
jgi:hypothetical protein